MSELIRDTAFGHIVHFVSKGKLLQYAEERDPNLWKLYIHRDQTKNIALHGNTDGQVPDEKEKRDGADSSEASSRTRHGDEESEYRMNRARTAEEERQYQMSSTVTGQRIDTEKGRDITMVTWFGDNDPEVRPSSMLATSSSSFEPDREVEPSQLVHLQKGLRDLRDLPPHLLRIHWVSRL